MVSVAFSPDGTRFASISNDQTLRLWDAMTGISIAVSSTLPDTNDSPYHIGFSPDGHIIASVWGSMLWLHDGVTASLKAGPFHREDTTDSHISYSGEHRVELPNEWRVWWDQSGRPVIANYANNQSRHGPLILFHGWIWYGGNPYRDGRRLCCLPGSHEGPYSSTADGLVVFGLRRDELTIIDGRKFVKWLASTKFSTDQSEPER
jgi:WD40 repeat protein